MNQSFLIDNRFQIKRQIGIGSFGVVYEAFDTQRNRTVALKTLARADADSVARFKREFRSLAELRHPNLAALYELIAAGDQWTLSMELVRGTDLLEHLSFAELQSSFLEQTHTEVPFDPDARIAIRRRPAAEGKLSAVYLGHVRETFRQLAEGLAFLHANGVVHRDVKPSNVLITQEGRVVLLDFGLAIDAASDPALEAGLLVGTPGYMSPEQIALARSFMMGRPSATPWRRGSESCPRRRGGCSGFCVTRTGRWGRMWWSGSWSSLRATNRCAR